MQIITRQALFPEGPLVRDGVLYYAEYGGDRVSAWDGKSISIFWSRKGSGPAAIGALGDDFVVACFASNEVAIVGRDGTTLRILNADETGGVLSGPNDIAPDGKGGVYLTLSGPWEPGPIIGRVVHLTAEGTLREVANDLHFANGIVRLDDRLFVNESEAHRVISFTIEADGSLSDRHLFLRMGEIGEAATAYPDGIKLGPDGNFYIGEFSAGRIVVVDQSGTPLRVIEVPSAAAPNLAFSDDGKTIFITAVDEPATAPYRGTVYALPTG
ncbi:MAG: SMP-30/gluconolactonase/LRE family protein [Rhizobiales bacterium]|nr:SMP-30/gluconolactonase/LRE family protein [Hyphomicrobiales bacterium]